MNKRQWKKYLKKEQQWYADNGFLIKPNEFFNVIAEQLINNRQYVRVVLQPRVERIKV